MFITEKEIGIAQAEPYVEIVIKGESDSAWEGGLNGKFYRIARNTAVKVPKNLAKLIFQSEQVTVLSKSETGEYREGSGKCLSERKRRTVKDDS